jgi:hypothetical protein
MFLGYIFSFLGMEYQGDMVATITAPLFWPMIRNVIMTFFLIFSVRIARGSTFTSREKKKREAQ